jgi:plasmid maintenance system antidote protein VapI
MKPSNRPLTQRKVSKIVKIKPDFFNHILKGRCPCPPQLAVKLEKVTAIDRRIWVWGTKEEKRTAWLSFQKKSQGDVLGR